MFWCITFRIQLKNFSTLVSEEKQLTHLTRKLFSFSHIKKITSPYNEDTFWCQSVFIHEAMYVDMRSKIGRRVIRCSDVDMPELQPSLLSQ